MVITSTMDKPLCKFRNKGEVQVTCQDVLNEGWNSLSYFQGRPSNFSDEHFVFHRQVLEELISPRNADTFPLLGSLRATFLLFPSMMKWSIPKWERSRPDWFPGILRQVTIIWSCQIYCYLDITTEPTGLWLITTKNDNYYHAKIVLINTAKNETFGNQLLRSFLNNWKLCI